MKRIMIAAAGTGGHVFPALAVADALQAEGWQVDWLGTTEQRLEARVVPAAGYPLHQLNVQGLRGHGMMRKLRAPLQLLNAVGQAWRLMRREQTAVVLTFGGYVSGPAGVAARLLRLPLLVHEQNAVPGLTTRYLSKLAQQVMVGFAAAKTHLPAAMVTGNPLRKDVLACRGKHGQTDAAIATPVNVLVVGGSLGAQVFNQQLPEMIRELSGQLQQPIKVLHQCGQGRQAEVTAAYAAVNSATVTVEVIEFIDAMAPAYANADVVICRAGALTVAELAAVGVASVLIPLPHAVDDHQTANAQVLVNAGAARLLPQAALATDGVKELQALLQQPEQLRTMARAAKQAAYPDATAAVVAQCNAWYDQAQANRTIKSPHHES